MKKIVPMLAVLLFTACQSHDLYDGAALERDTKKAYSDNFVKTFPNVNLNQSWDYSNKNEAYSLLSSTNAARFTRATESYEMTTDGEYEVDTSTLTWLKNKLTAGKTTAIWAILSI